MASIGHELRNPLGVLESSLFMVRERAPDDPKLRRHLDRMGEQIAHSNKIISDFLDLIRERPRRRAKTAVAALVEAAVASIRWPDGVRRTVEVADGLPAIDADPDQARQVLTNLLTNAIDAAGEAGEVRLVARAGNADVTFVVADSGPGIAVEVRNRLFEPLVTTKRSGTGLGLAVCRRLAEANGGSIEVVPGPLAGAAFEVRLPAAGREP
jgi:signal transduction histidine kinase